MPSIVIVDCDCRPAARVLLFECQLNESMAIRADTVTCVRFLWFRWYANCVVKKIKLCDVALFNATSSLANALVSALICFDLLHLYLWASIQRDLLKMLSFTILYHPLSLTD